MINQYNKKQFSAKKKVKKSKCATYRQARKKYVKIKAKKKVFKTLSSSFLKRQFKSIIQPKEERSGGTVDWPFMLCSLNVM